MLDRRKAVELVGKSESKGRVTASDVKVFVTLCALTSGVTEERGEIRGRLEVFAAEGGGNVVPRADWHRTTEQGALEAIARVRELVKARREALTREFEKLAAIEEGLSRGVLPMRKKGAGRGRGK